MVKKAKKKAKARKRLTPLEKIQKELAKIEALHAKEEAIIENITDIIDEEDSSDWRGEWEGTD